MHELVQFLTDKTQWESQNHLSIQLTYEGGNEGRFQPTESFSQWAVQKIRFVRKRHITTSDWILLKMFDANRYSPRGD